MKHQWFSWLFSDRVPRRSIFVIACMATLVAGFYSEENWRGKRVWEKNKHELEAQGKVLDWGAYIPAPVPDEQNIFKAPKITEGFVGKIPSGFTMPKALSAFLRSKNTNSVF